MTLFFALIFFLSPSLNASFVISEIFGNGPGRSRDQGKEWIELNNITSQTIDVHHIKLSIVTNNQQTFTQSVELSSPLSFRTTMLLAHNQQLGLSRCLNKIPVAIIPDFSIANSGEIKICVTLNRTHQSCSILSKKFRRADGVALFRDPHDSNEKPLFMPEPCLLIDGIFATPGLPARACAINANMADLIFTPCPSASGITPELRVVRVDDKMFDASTLAIHENNNDVFVNLHPASEDPIIVTTCSAPFNSAAICREMNNSVVSLQGAQISLPVDCDSAITYLRIRNFHGAQNKQNLAPKKLPRCVNDQAWKPQVTADWQKKQLHLTFSLTNDDVPLNLWVESADGTIMHQRALLLPQSFNWSVDFHKAKLPARLRFAGIRGKGFLSLKDPERLKEPIPPVGRAEAY